MSERIIKILVIEPERDLGAMIRLALDGYKLKVDSVAGSVDAKSRLVQGAPDLVISDLVLGDNPKGGAILCAELRSHPNFVGLPVLLVSDSLDQSEVSTASSSGAVGILQKPLDEESLRSKVEQILGLGSEESSSLTGKYSPVTEEKPLSYEEDNEPPLPDPGFGSAPVVQNNSEAAAPNKFETSAPPPEVSSPQVGSSKEDRLKVAQTILAKSLHSLRKGNLLDVIELEDVPRVVLETTKRFCLQEEQANRESDEAEDTGVDLSSVLNK